MMNAKLLSFSDNIQLLSKILIYVVHKRGFFFRFFFNFLAFTITEELMSIDIIVSKQFKKK